MTSTWMRNLAEHHADRVVAAQAEQEMFRRAPYLFGFDAPLRMLTEDQAASIELTRWSREIAADEAKTARALIDDVDTGPVPPLIDLDPLLDAHPVAHVIRTVRSGQ